MTALPKQLPSTRPFSGLCSVGCTASVGCSGPLRAQTHQEVEQRVHALPRHRVTQRHNEILQQAQVCPSAQHGAQRATTWPALTWCCLGRKTSAGSARTYICRARARAS
jgi:hypothetical protein